MSNELMLKITEHEFGDILLNSAEIQKLVKTNTFLVAREFKVGSGVPDFVLISEDDYRQISDLSKKYPPEAFRGINSSLICMLYGSLHEKDLANVAQANFVDINVAIRAAKKLSELNVLEFNRNDLKVKRCRDFTLPKVDVISLELKLDKWKKALWQASRNKAYYAKSYVVMPADKEELIRQHMTFFDVNGVSAVVVDPLGGKLKFISKKNLKNENSTLTTHRLTGLSYLMQQKDLFTHLSISN